MSDPAVSAFLQVLFQGIADFVKKELQLVDGLDHLCERLISNVEMLQGVLREAEKMQLSSNAKKLFGKLKDVGYDAAEVLDEASYEFKRQQVIPFAYLRNLNIVSTFNPLRMKFRHGMEERIKKIFEQIEDINKSLSILAEFSPLFEHQQRSTHQQTCLRLTDVCGRKTDQEKIVKMLLQSDQTRHIAVLPIVGEPYIGKTTITKEVFNDDQVSRYFELLLWVHVSPDFNIEKITASIIESIEGSPFHCCNLNTLQMRLGKQLQGRRYLLVLDDYWREEWHDWEKLKLPLITGAAGSKIIVTTRISAVARVLGTIGPYQLQCLPQNDCWSLFCQCAQIEADNSGDLQHNRLKEKVVQKCRGVPFIAASLGHKVRQEIDRRKWETIVQEEHWNSRSGDDFYRALRLSYAQLESHLKPCFAYSSVIPPKLPFNEEWLIQHWMAQGFMEPNPDVETIEEVGRSCFRALVERSFFHRAVVDPTGEQHGYILSHMMHDLALHVSGEDCICYVMGKGPLRNPQKVRHLTVDLNNLADKNMFDVISEAKCLRTLIIVGSSENFVLRIPNDIEQRFPRLHTLDLSNSGVTELPVSVGKLKHLRCLQLQSTKVRQLPDSICELFLLQTLGLRNCYFLAELPCNINNLRKLRHIDLVMTCNPFHNVCSLTCMPKDIGLLTDLQTLSRFVIRKTSNLTIHTHEGGIGELANLNNLNGELLISGLEHVNDVKEAARAHLASKQFLQKIGLSWGVNDKEAEQNVEHLEHVNDGEEAAHSRSTLKQIFKRKGFPGSNSNKAKQIMEHLEPPITIKELTVSGYSGMACPRWLGSPGYKELVTLYLNDFKSCTVVPCLGQLPHLENLHIKGWDGLNSMDCSTFCGSNTARFQSLKKLHLEELGRFHRWDGDDECAFPSLLELVIKNCRKLEQLTHKLPSLTKIRMEGSPNFSGLRNFPSLTHVDVTASDEWIWRSWSALSSPISITLSKLLTVRLPSVPRQLHSSLQHLHISHCERLESLPEDWPPRNLSHFSVKHCPQLRELPSGIQNLRALENLEIIDCERLTFLPDMGALTSLLWMEISDCGSIRFPSQLPGSIQFLSISNCPQLSLSCMNEGSLHQENIKRIFSVWIDGHEVST